MNVHRICCGAWLSWSLVLALVLLPGCGDEGLFDPDLSYPSEVPPTTGMTALQFPTGNGSAWTYQETASDTVHTLTVEGLSYEQGRTLRQLTNSNLDAPTDFYAANAWYLRIDGFFFRAFGFPISATYFDKTADAYTEIAFDAFLPGFEQPTFHQLHFPSRKLWEFPLTTGQTWVVFQTAVSPIATATRTVVADSQSVNTLQGNYTNAYLVEESFQVEGEVVENPVARYWLVPDVGIVKYEYQFPGGQQLSYELVRFVG